MRRRLNCRGANVTLCPLRSLRQTGFFPLCRITHHPPLSRASYATYVKELALISSATANRITGSWRRGYTANEGERAAGVSGRLASLPLRARLR